MLLKRQYLTQNACYKAGRTIKPRGIMVHSTGANNPTLRRYVAPDDGLLGKNQYGNHWNQDKPDGKRVCVHAFIGKLADGRIATYQTLPWDMRGWHAGSGGKGSANDTHISFEICEDGLADAAYLRSVYREAVELCALLCREYALDPLADGVIICHAEGYRRGVASNHGDVLHWWPRHGLTMDAFRADVAAELNPIESEEPEVRYAKLKDIPNTWGGGEPRATIEKLMDAGILQGDGSDPHGNDDVIDLSHDMVRMLLLNYRGGVYDKQLVASGLLPAVR